VQRTRRDGGHHRCAGSITIALGPSPSSWPIVQPLFMAHATTLSMLAVLCLIRAVARPASAIPAWRRLPGRTVAVLAPLALPNHACQILAALISPGEDCNFLHRYYKAQRELRAVISPRVCNMRFLTRS